MSGTGSDDIATPQSRHRVPLEELSTHEMSKTVAARSKNDKKMIGAVLNSCDWYVSHCKNDLIDMGIVKDGKLIDGLSQLTGPPNLKKKKKNEHAYQKNSSRRTTVKKMMACPGATRGARIIKNFIEISPRGEVPRQAGSVGFWPMPMT